MNIRKCEFNVEETVFLEVIVSKLNLCWDHVWKLIRVCAWLECLIYRDSYNYDFKNKEERSYKR